MGRDIYKWAEGAEKLRWVDKYWKYVQIERKEKKEKKRKEKRKTASANGFTATTNNNNIEKVTKQLLQPNGTVGSKLQLIRPEVYPTLPWK